LSAAGASSEEVSVPERRILLVGSDFGRQLDEKLVDANYHIVQTNTGEAAVAFASHSSFTTVVLKSSSGDMDLTETALTLVDIQPWLNFIILKDWEHEENMSAEKAAILRAIPKSRSLTEAELSSCL
jgi:hypothetical protein